MSAPDRPLRSSAQITAAMLQELGAAEPGKFHCYCGDGRDLPAAIDRHRAAQAREKGRER